MTRNEALAAVGKQNAGSVYATLSGHQAVRLGLGWTRNPYPHGTPLHRAWLDGYRIAVETPVPAYRLPGDRRAA